MMENKKYASFFGGAINDTTTTEYVDSISIGKLLAEKRFSVKNGGYRGLMEAVSIGATSVPDGEAIGYLCDTFGPSNGNKHLTEKIRCKDIYDRLRLLVEGSELFIIQAGGVGTLAELALVLDTTRKLKTKPMIVLFGTTWARIMTEISVIMSEEDYNRLFFCYNYREFESMINKIY